MPRYYFDLKDGTRLRDHDGVDLKNDAAAISHAETIAVEVARENVPGPQRFVSVIRFDSTEVARVPVEQANVVKFVRKA